MKNRIIALLENLDGLIGEIHMIAAEIETVFPDSEANRPLDAAWGMAVAARDTILGEAFDGGFMAVTDGRQMEVELTEDAAETVH